MKKLLPALFAALVLAWAASSSSRGADAAASKTPAPVLKSVSCPPECGFMCRSHDETELIAIVKAHARSAHGKDLTDEQIRGFMQAEPPPAGKKG